MASIRIKSVFGSIFTFLLTLTVLGQNPQQFDQDIAKFNSLSVDNDSSLVVFTGSSSIRFWTEVDSHCKAAKVINTGFGGSQFSDLLYFIDQTVIRFKPSKVFIYEGDNDVAAEKSTADIMKTAKKVVCIIRSDLPEAEIYLIGAKPSPSRWQFKSAYLELNKALKVFCETEQNLTFIDVWNPMINTKQRPDPSLFILDSLHMNAKGYRLWTQLICPFVN